MGNFLLYSRRNCPYFYIGGELKKVNFTLQVSPEKINKETETFLTEKKVAHCESKC